MARGRIENRKTGIMPDSMIVYLTIKHSCRKVSL